MSRYTSHTNDSMWKLLFGLSGLIVGTFIGASMPEIAFKQSANPTTSQTAPQSEAQEDEPQLCSGPECMSAPPAKVPSNIQPISLSNNYLAVSLQIAANQSNNQPVNQSVDEAECFALIIGAVSQYSNYSAIQQSIKSTKLHDLFSCLVNHGYTIKHDNDGSMTKLRSAVQAGQSALVYVQSITQSTNPSTEGSTNEEVDWLKVNDHARPMLVVGYDSFYIYLLDCEQSINQTTNGSINLLYCPAREFSRRWHSFDQTSGERITGQCVIIQSPAAPTLTKEEAKKSFQNIKLKQLQ